MIWGSRGTWEAPFSGALGQLRTILPLGIFLIPTSSPMNFRGVGIAPTFSSSLVSRSRERFLGGTGCDQEGPVLGTKLRGESGAAWRSEPCDLRGALGWR